MQEIESSGATDDDSVEARVLGRPGIKPNFVLSQKDYRPTPYQDAAWEVVGERMDTKRFFPLELEVIPRAVAATDPMFEDFGSPLTQGADRLLHSRTGEAVRDEEEEIERAPVMDEELLAAKMAEAFEQGKAEGEKEGFERAKETIEQRYNALQTRFTALETQIHDELRKVISRVETQGVALALNVAKKILVTTAEVKPEYIFEVIRAGLKSLGGALPFRIRVSREDHEFITVVGLPQELSAEDLGVEYVSDEAIASGCVIETNFGEVDLRVESMWQQVKENLFGVK